ncbi:NAD(P)/FAD-dependent oxidoreductase [Paenibacillus chartarius]|uniref:NAD(P)/FAD-dependent oxidoreductase n=1 Tax=Paenibacillus chartarius TaxID=747481 RepID=A0ABV6DK54_9BACL
MDKQEYDAIIIGGGIAGLQAAIQLGRSLRKVVVIDKGEGRSTLCRSYHNVLGYPNGISGEELRYIGRGQAEKVGVQFVLDEAVDAKRLQDGRFEVTGKLSGVYRCDELLIATGIADRLPEVPGLKPCLGKTIYICPDCDGYEVKNKSTVVIGSGGTGAGMAVSLLYFTDRVTLVNHVWEGGPAKAIPPELEQQLRAGGVDIVTGTIAEVVTKGDGEFQAVRLTDGRELAGERGFASFGGNTVNTKLFQLLGAERMESGHVVVEPRTQMTSVPGLFAAGDVAVHSEQLTIAMGNGQQAAIWIHKRLKERDKKRAGGSAANAAAAGAR